MKEREGVENGGQTQRPTKGSRAKSHLEHWFALRCRAGHLLGDEWVSSSYPGFWNLDVYFQPAQKKKIKHRMRHQSRKVLAARSTSIGITQPRCEVGLAERTLLSKGLCFPSFSALLRWPAFRVPWISVGTSLTPKPALISPALLPKTLRLVIWKKSAPVVLPVSRSVVLQLPEPELLQTCRGC